MSNAEDLQAIEMSIEDAKLSIARKDQLVRLQKNPDFQALIEKGFMEKHAVRQVLLKSHPGVLSNEIQMKIIDNQIAAIGGFKQFLIGVYTEGMNAEVALSSDEVTREELLKEGLENGD